MKRQLVLLRPQPGNDQTAERGRSIGIDVVQIPLFETLPVEMEGAPAGPFDAVLVTSANGVRYGADIFSQLAHLPVYTVGEASAQAARDHGAREVHAGGGDAASTIPLLVAGRHKAVVHLCGEDVRPFDPMGLTITSHVVYRSEPRDARLFAKTLASLPPSVMAIHSPRAGRRLNALIPAEHRYHFLIAISSAAAQAAGAGWRRVQVAETPDDTALLRLASTLCMAAS